MVYDGTTAWMKNFKVIETFFHSCKAEKYLPLFRKLRVTFSDLVMLDDDQLKIIGVDDPDIRKELMSSFQCLPVVYTQREDQTLSTGDYVKLMNNMSDHLEDMSHCIKMESRLAKDFPEHHNVLLKPNLHVSTVILKTCDKMVQIIEQIEKAENKSLKKQKLRRQKWVVGIVGSVTIVVMSFYFVKTLKYCK